MDLTRVCDLECQSINFETVKSHPYLTVTSLGGCIDCDHRNPCTVDNCVDGICFYESLCPGGEVCRPEECCPAERCCENNECCPEPCEGCDIFNGNGELSGREVTVSPEVVCVGETITFTASGVTDSGGVKRVFCTAKEAIPPVEVSYEWRITKPDGTIVPPLDQEPGTGPVATIVTDQPGMYSCSFTAKADRECPPDSVSFGGSGVAVEVEISEDAGQLYGHDDWTWRMEDPPVPFKSVEAGQADTAILNVTPAEAADQLHLTSSDSAIVVVTPTIPTASPQTIMLEATAVGASTVSIRPGDAAAIPCQPMEVSTYERLTFTVAIILVHEENDDEQKIELEQGQPNTICIRGGANLVFDGTLEGDDWVETLSDTNEEVVRTGANGICESAASGDDFQIIDVGKGKPDQRCVGKGNNGFRDTGNVDYRNEIDGNDEISTGPDGICWTVANNQNVLSTDYGTGEEIKAFLNDIYRQAVVEWIDVRKEDPIVVNFDLNRNFYFNVTDVEDCDTIEVATIKAAGENPNFDFSVFFVDNPSPSLLGLQCGRSAFVFVDQHEGDLENVAITLAHELGHALGLHHPDADGDNDMENLMHSTPSGKRLRKPQWDRIRQ